MAKPNAWTAADDARLAQLWEGGATAKEIADLFGDRSRNSIIGRKTRLGLSQRVNPVDRTYAPTGTQGAVAQLVADGLELKQAALRLSISMASAQWIWDKIVRETGWQAV